MKKAKNEALDKKKYRERKKPYIFYCTDDFGATETSCDRIVECAGTGFLNKISVFPNTEVPTAAEKLEKIGNAALSLHLNFVEGSCVGDKEKLDLLTDKNGCFRHTFFGLFILSVFSRKKLKEQIKYETRCQIEKFRSEFNKDNSLFLDSHQHTHMIPALFSALSEVIVEDRLNVKYLRIPTEPVSPFLKEPSLYTQYLSVNLIKQLLLNFFGLINRKKQIALGIPNAAFFGILFSGNMNENRVRKILPHYIDYAIKKKCDIEVLFHLGYVDAASDEKYLRALKFRDFYLSPNRKAEYEAAMNMTEFCPTRRKDVK